MDISQEIRRDLDEACRLALTGHSGKVRNRAPFIETSSHGEVVVTLPVLSPEAMDVWIRLCQTKTRGEVSANTQTKTVFFKP